MTTSISSVSFEEEKTESQRMKDNTKKNRKTDKVSY